MLLTLIGRASADSTVVGEVITKPKQMNNAMLEKIDHWTEALVAFLKAHRPHLDHVTGVRYSGEFGHPFHVVDEELVILSVDHPFVPQWRVASFMLRDA